MDGTRKSNYIFVIEILVSSWKLSIQAEQFFKASREIDNRFEESNKSDVSQTEVPILD